MINPVIVDAIYQGLTVLFLLSLPIIAIVFVGGLISAAIQTSTNIQEPVLSYAIKTGALVGALYFMSPIIIAHLRNILELALK